MNKFEELKNPNYAIDFLSEHLIKGSLVLFLGAGVSRGFGLPNWIELVNSFRKELGLPNIDIDKAKSDVNYLQSSTDEALDFINHDNSKKVEIIQKILYESQPKLDVSSVYKHHLLVAISSLLIGRRRGHIKQIITLNYDSMLEWFLEMFGFNVNSISNLPALEGSEDVRIYHMHGFVPHPDLDKNASDNLILGLHDANLRTGARYDLWLEKIRQILESSVCLFIGLSGNTLSDRAISPILSNTGLIFKDERPLGIWLVKDRLETTKEKEFFRTNIVPLEIDDADEIANFVLKISQKALEKIKNFV